MVGRIVHALCTLAGRALDAAGRHRVIYDREGTWREWIYRKRARGAYKSPEVPLSIGDTTIGVGDAVFAPERQRTMIVEKLTIDGHAVCKWRDEKGYEGRYACPVSNLKKA